MPATRHDLCGPAESDVAVVVFDIDDETGSKSVKDIKEQEVYMGDLPFMTENGTFVVTAPSASSFRR